MDNAIDQMQKTAKTIMLFDQRAFTPQQREMGDAIVTAAALVQEAMPLLSSINTNAGRVNVLTEQISKIEGHADDLHDIGMQELYRINQPANAMAFFVGSEIYDHLEKVVDRFDDVGERNPGHRARERLVFRPAGMDVVTLALPLLIALIVVALAFDFLNGLHDAANSIATIVSTRVLRPQTAVAWAAFFNFVAFLVFGAHVAQTVGTGIISADIVDPRVVFGALMGAISWNLLTWWLGLPSSSSHALIGGLVGAGTARSASPRSSGGGSPRPARRSCCRR